MFGNPGSTEELFLKDFPADFRYVLGLHEASVVNMAVGYALAGDRAALVNLHTAAGMGNAMAAIINAHHAKAPLVITAGQQHRAMEVLEPFLWGRQVEFARPYVKWSCEPHRAVDVPAALARAYHTPKSAPRGPVFVSICMDGLDDECPALATRTVAGNPVPDPTAIHTMAEVLNASRRVAMVVGEELDDPETGPGRCPCREAPAAVSARRRTSASASRPATRSSGFLPPAIKPLSDRLAGSDALLVLGTRVFAYYPYTTGSYCPRASALSTSRATRPRRRAPQSGRRVAAQGGRADAPGPGRGRRSPRRSAPGPEPPESGTAEPITPAFVYRTLAEVMPPHAVVVEESLSSLAVHQNLIPRDEPGLLPSFGNGILGPALPMSCWREAGEALTARSAASSATG